MDYCGLVGCCGVVGVVFVVLGMLVLVYGFAADLLLWLGASCVLACLLSCGIDCALRLRWLVVNSVV